MKHVYIVRAKRSPIASVLVGKDTPNTSSIVSISPQELAGQVLRALFKDTLVRPEDIDYFIAGSAISQKFERSLLHAGAKFVFRHAFPRRQLPAVGILVEKACSSGLFAPWLGAKKIMTGEADLVVAGGFDKMCGYPNSLIVQGLTDLITGYIMAQLADAKAKTLGKGFGRTEHDEFARESYRLAKEHLYDHDIVPICSPADGTVLLDHNEEPAKFWDRLKLLSSPRINYPGCEIMTTLNSSKYGSGAGFLLLASEKAVKEYGLTPVARFVGFGEHSEGTPEDFIIAPYGAATKALESAGLNASDIEHWENNPAFPTAPLYLMEKFHIPREDMNSWSDAIADGHPIAATGPILIAKSLQILKERNRKPFGIIPICNATAEATAAIIEVL